MANGYAKYSGIGSGIVAGDVTSVTASSPLQSSGGTAPNISFINQSANLVLAGPTTGAAAAPTFRALVAADFPAGTFANTALSNLAAVAINTSLLPAVNGAINLGDATHEWGDGYINNLKDSSGVAVLQTNNRVLLNTGGTPVIDFSADPIVVTPAVSISKASTSALKINTTSFIFDSTNNALGIGVQPGTATFIDGVNTSGATKRLLLTGYGTASLVGFRTRLARGTSGSPTAVQTGDIIGFFNSEGYGATTFPATGTGAISIIAGENFTDSSNLTYVTINSTPTGSVTSTENFRVASTGVTIGPQASSTALHSINGGIQWTVKAVATTYTVDTTTSDYLLSVNTSGGGFTITLPTPTVGRVIIIKDTTGSFGTNNLTLARHAAENIENVAASFIFQTNYGQWMIWSDGTNWWIS